MCGIHVNIQKWKAFHRSLLLPPSSSVIAFSLIWPTWYNSSISNIYDHSYHILKTYEIVLKLFVEVNNTLTCKWTTIWELKEKAPNSSINLAFSNDYWYTNSDINTHKINLRKQREPHFIGKMAHECVRFAITGSGDSTGLIKHFGSITAKLSPCHGRICNRINKNINSSSKFSRHLYWLHTITAMATSGI